MGLMESRRGGVAMNARDIFPDFDLIVNEDYDALINGAENAMKAAKKQRKQGEIMKAQKNVFKKQRELSDISKQG